MKTNMYIEQLYYYDLDMHEQKLNYSLAFGNIKGLMKSNGQKILFNAQVYRVDFWLVINAQLTH